MAAQDDGGARPHVSDELHGVLALILDAGDATTGGGSAAALSGAMAAGLMGMVARLSVGKGLELGDERYRACAAEAEELRDALAEGAAADAAAYSLIKAAYSLPKSDEAEKAARQAAIQRALIAAATVPRDNARRAAKVLDLCRELSGRSNDSAASDLAVALQLAEVGVLGSAANIDVNVAGMDGVPEAQVLLAEAAQLRRHAEGPPASASASPPKESS
jgi:formiminotetrahydrofolate cyclodeaminase